MAATSSRRHLLTSGRPGGADRAASQGPMMPPGIRCDADVARWLLAPRAAARGPRRRPAARPVRARPAAPEARWRDDGSSMRRRWRRRATPPIGARTLPDPNQANRASAGRVARATPESACRPEEDTRVIPSLRISQCEVRCAALGAPPCARRRAFDGTRLAHRASCSQRARTMPVLGHRAPSGASGWATQRMR